MAFFRQWSMFLCYAGLDTTRGCNPLFSTVAKVLNDKTYAHTNQKLAFSAKNVYLWASCTQFTQKH
jgi:hypothetical protein